MRETLRKVLAILTSRERRKLVWLFIAVLIMATLEVVGIVSILPFLSVVANPGLIQDNQLLHRVYEYFEFDDTNRFLFALGGLALFTLAVNNLFTAATTWYTFRYAYRLNHTLSQKMLRRYLYRPYSYFLDHHSSDLTVKTISEVSQVVNWLIIPIIDSMSRGVVSLFIGLMILV